jgi:hypothetical protein
MKLRYRGSKQRYAGLLLIFFGGFAVIAAQRYPIGTATNMGPGFFPAALGIMLLLLGGAAQFGPSEEESDPVSRHEIITLVSICAGIVAFGELVERLGLAAGILGTVVCSCFLRLRRQFLEVLIIYLVLVTIAVGLFIYVLRLPFRAFIFPS